MLTRRRGVRLLSKLVGIRCGRDKVRQQARGGHRHEKSNRRCARPLHASLARNVLPNRSEAELATSVTKVTIIVRLTSKATSLPRAAFQANCPMPGMSHSASIG